MSTELPNKYIVKGLDDNANSLRRIEDKLDKKVGRAEFFGWFAILGTVLGLSLSACT